MFLMYVVALLTDSCTQGVMLEETRLLYLVSVAAGSVVTAGLEEQNFLFVAAFQPQPDGERIRCHVSLLSHICSSCLFLHEVQFNRSLDSSRMLLPIDLQCSS